MYVFLRQTWSKLLEFHKKTMFSPPHINRVYFWRRQTTLHYYKRERGESTLLMRRLHSVQLRVNKEVPTVTTTNFFSLIVTEKSSIKKSNVNSTYVATIPVVIFWSFLMFYQIFFSPQLKGSAIISNKHELSRKLRNDFRLRILEPRARIPGNQETSAKPLNATEL